MKADNMAVAVDHSGPASSQPLSINQLGLTAHQINAANGFDIFYETDWPPERGGSLFLLCAHMALVHSEISEATEAIRFKDRANFEEELADAIIRITSISHGLGIDLEAVIAAKLEKNRSRGFRHGGKAI